MSFATGGVRPLWRRWGLAACPRVVYLPRRRQARIVGNP